MKLHKDICSPWMSRTSAEFFFSQIDVIKSQKYNRSVVILRRTLYGFSEACSGCKFIFSFTCSYLAGWVSRFVRVTSGEIQLTTRRWQTDRGTRAAKVGRLWEEIAFLHPRMSKKSRSIWVIRVRHGDRSLWHMSHIRKVKIWINQCFYRSWVISAWNCFLCHL